MHITTNVCLPASLLVGVEMEKEVWGGHDPVVGAQ